MNNFSDIFKNMWRKIKIYGPQQFETGPTAWETFAQTPLLRFIFEWEELAKIHWKKKKNESTQWIIFTY